MSGQDRVAEAITVLPYKEKVVLSLMFEHNMDIFEAAKVMEMKPRKVLTLYSHAIIHLNYELMGFRGKRCRSCGVLGIQIIYTQNN